MVRKISYQMKFSFWPGPAVIGLSCCSVPAYPLFSLVTLNVLFSLAKLIKQNISNSQQPSVNKIQLLPQAIDIWHMAIPKRLQNSKIKLARENEKAFCFLFR